MHDFDSLCFRLENSSGPVAVVVGSALSISWGPPKQGVPDVSGMIELIRAHTDRTGCRNELETALARVVQTDHYQAAFSFLGGRFSPTVIDDIVHAAVLKARLPNVAEDFDADGDHAHWHIPKGTAALGRLLAGHGERFGPVLTTNFDPLISLAIERAGGRVERHVLPLDGNLPGPADSDVGVRVIHLHGYWRDSETRHLPQHLKASRPQLAGSLRSLLRGRTVLVVAYGGWPDVFMHTLEQVLTEPNNNLEVLWCFHADEARTRFDYAALLGRLEGRTRFTAYCGIDAHALFERLAPAPPTSEVAQSVQSKRPSRKQTRREFLAACPQPVGTFFAELLEDALHRGHSVKWWTKGFTIAIEVQGERVGLCYGYPPGVRGVSDAQLHVYLPRELPAELRAWAQIQYERAAPFQDGGEFTLKLMLDESVLADARKSVEILWKVADRLRRSSVQVWENGDTGDGDPVRPSRASEAIGDPLVELPEPPERPAIADGQAAIGRSSPRTPVSSMFRAEKSLMLLRTSDGAPVTENPVQSRYNIVNSGSYMCTPDLLLSLYNPNPFAVHDVSVDVEFPEPLRSAVRIKYRDASRSLSRVPEAVFDASRPVYISEPRVEEGRTVIRHRIKVIPPAGTEPLIGMALEARTKQPLAQLFSTQEHVIKYTVQTSGGAQSPAEFRFIVIFERGQFGAK